jgi:hypothetical protein
MTRTTNRRTLPLSIGLAFVAAAAAGCGTSATAPSPQGPFLTSDDPAIDHSWPTQLPSYDATFLSEADVAKNLGLDGGVRTQLASGTNQFRYETADATLEVDFQYGLDRPFSYVSYRRVASGVPIDSTVDAGLRGRWEAAAEVAAAFAGRLTRLTPVVQIGGGTDAERATALQQGFSMQFLAPDNREVWVDGFFLQVDQSGVRSFDTEALAYDLVPGTGAIDCRTREEVAAIATANKLGPIPPNAQLIFLGYSGKLSDTLFPFYLASDSGGAPQGILLDRSIASPLEH